MDEKDFRIVQNELRQSINRSGEFRLGSQLHDRGQNASVKYLPCGSARRIMTRETCKKAISGVMGSEDQSNAAREEQSNIYCDKVLDTPGCFIILLTVISYGTFQTLQLFYEHFLKNPCGKDDRHLPFDEDFVIQQFPNDPDNNFFAGQFTYLAVTLKAGDFRQEYQPSRVLPWEWGTELGRGAYGQVFKVKVERGHFSFKEPASSNADVSIGLLQT